MENKLPPETPGEKIVGANWEGDIAFLQKMADTGQFDPLEITESERWNYLHRANLINPRPLQNSPKSPKFPSRHLGDFS